MPSAGADMSELTWESPGERGAAADMDLLSRTMAANEIISVREQPDRPASPHRSDATSLEFP